MNNHVTLEDLAECYDTFFIDQFGVLLDGVKAYPGSIEALHWLKSRSKEIVILSNSGRSGAYNTHRLVALGFDASSFDHFVTSGDVARHLITSGALVIPAGAGPRCLTISVANDSTLADSLGFTRTDSGHDADLVVIAGSEADRVPMQRYQDLLAPAAARKTLCVCTNPDINMLTGKGLAPAAGAIAKLYEEMGGPVMRIGKPYRDIYDYALHIVRQKDKSRIVAIGDSVEHDIVGANRFGIAAALVRTGVLADTSVSQLQRISMDLNVDFPEILPNFAREIASC
ncbi:TIGR01459 family HAD-type hydrolase [Phyllobacterium bourgognense]|uniref:HAD superfamily hydrolase (TIGR01459 family) n=1 Tax=Phyllobacterium bourgognense TaxID=314236 RepID=A0A368YLZ7_9HYPH|nr:TIGR01459 family HAD-type hydrolase [Phyllobacterium bourgognense]RCW81250.1 HAD superfamily hydrolase (TIGR01459 family) [Phyllobacterium bourgognense]